MFLYTNFKEPQIDGKSFTSFPSFETRHQHFSPPMKNMQ